MVDDQKAAIHLGKIMKSASAATLAILASGKYYVADLYTITLVTGASYYFTASDLPWTAAVYPSSTTNTYLEGYAITRANIVQSIGLDAQEMELTISQKWDNPGGIPTIAGYSIAQAARLGLLDNAEITLSLLFMNYPVPPAQWDTSPKAVAFFQGAVSGLQVTRASTVIKVSSDILVLNQVQMPKNLYQAPCTHTVYDAGCTLSKSTYTVSGTIAVVTNNYTFSTNLTQADFYFNLGVIKFTSGLNNGYSATVKSYVHSNGSVLLVIPMPANLANGDTFSIYPGCDHTQATCVSKFNNLIHFKGMPYVPVPETLYDGGTSNPPSGNSPANQAGSIVGSQIGGIIRK